MQTTVITTDAGWPNRETLATAGRIIAAGGLVAFPTETVYGLGANALDASAVERIFAAKGRPATNPVIVHVADVAEARRLTSSWPAVAQRLADRFWPGSLTLVLPKAADVPDVVTAGGPTVGVRVPAHPVALGLIRAANTPIAAPSANRSLAISPTRAEHVLRGLDGQIDLLLDAGPTSGGLESTVIDLTHASPRLLRPGLVTRGDIERVIGPTEAEAARQHVPLDGPARSPGMLARHYAPSMPLECCSASRSRVEELARQGEHIGWLTFAGEGGAAPTGIHSVHVVELPRDPRGYAAGLYAALHALDLSGVDRIIVEVPPAGDAWQAVCDRLTRASW
jgi:L-threonylcarbamoyladenylate synthase